jgi:hypothetical protein
MVEARFLILSTIAVCEMGVSPMKPKVITLTILLTSIGLIAPVAAQIRNPSQDFFEQGRERVEREIHLLQSKPENSEENQQKPKPEPLLEVLPSPEFSPNQKPMEVETHQQKPNEPKFD